MSFDPNNVQAVVARILEEGGVTYLVGGSIASSYWGEPRTSVDVDFALHLEVGRAQNLAAAFSTEF